MEKKQEIIKINQVLQAVREHKRAVGSMVMSMQKDIIVVFSTAPQTNQNYSQGCL